MNGARAERLRAALCAARQERMTITGHDAPDVDSVVSCVLMRDLLAYWEIHAAIVLPTRADAQARRVMQRFGMDADGLRGEITHEDALVLVDHHRPLHPGRVAACVDHHPTDYPPEYPYVQIEPVGACAVMVLGLMRDAGMAVSPEQERMAVAALYLDTVALRSAKISAGEAAWARERAGALGLDEGWLLREGMNMRDLRLPPRELALTGRKRYDFGGRRVESTYVQTDAMTQTILERILHEIRREMWACGACRWVFLVHDPVAVRTTRYDMDEEGGVTVMRYGELVSRGKTVMPQVEREMRGGESRG